MTGLVVKTPLGASDDEVLAIYLFGIMQGYTQIKSIHHYAQTHLSGWIWRSISPTDLPSYQRYVDRLGRLAYAFIALTEPIKNSTPNW